VNWPDPVTSNTSSQVESRIDDLWHAAINGQGQYFSAKDPSQLTAGLSKALQAIGAKVGAGAAAATSTLNPVAGDNSAYVASYTTVQWSGNLESRSINTVTGQVSQDATWCAEDVVAGSCAAPGSIVANTSGSSTTYTCNTGGATAATCAAPGVLVGTVCQLEVPTSCTGTMAAKVADVTDTRTIYTNVGTSLGAFTYANLTAAQQTNFNSAFLAANLSQWSSFNSVQQTAAAGTNLVNFLRGQNGFEIRASNLLINQLYRTRSTVMADALESKPAFIGKPTFSYLDPGYSSFKTAKAGRLGTVFIGTNDGMLHAFDSATGNERWAYVPSMVIPNMWKLADANYSNMHTNYVNGDSIISDVCSANCTDAATAIWNTILVAGLNGGGKGYIALDITVPNTPVLLWEFDTTKDDDLGYTFGNPVITKKADGTWVVLFTSGYNNTTGSNPGKGFLYVVDALTGSVISKMPTGAGSSAAPSGLAKIAAFASDTEKDNTATFTYGGDLSGNIWRFDINAAAVAGTNPLKFATLFSDAAGSVPQPITTRPELGLVKSKRVVFVGTGKYLETSDLTNTQLQTLYAIKDDDATTTLVNPRTTLVQQTITGTSASRKINSPQPVDFASGNGWFVNFPDGATASPATPSERQNVNSQLVAGTLLVPTTVPSNTVCSPGGYGWLNFFDFKTGGPVTNSGSSANVVSARTNAPIVGINVLFVPDTSAGAAAGAEKPVVSVVTADQPTPQLVPPVPFNPITSIFQQKRVIWRELTN
jgi:type IV pilus assembly protein PilY1